MQKKLDKHLKEWYKGSKKSEFHKSGGLASLRLSMKGCKVAGCKVFDVRVLSSMSQDVQSAEIRGEASATFFIFVPPKESFAFYLFSVSARFPPCHFKPSGMLCYTQC